jgi:hypothetical protein
MAKTVSLTDVGALKNALRRYAHGQKLEIAQFNQVAGLAFPKRIVRSRCGFRDARFFRSGEAA